MGMDKNRIKAGLISYRCPRWNQLPDFELYMDQVVFFVNDRLSPLFFDSNVDKIITSNMVNNYVKNSIVHPPVKKHYKQYHLAFLIAVCILKRCYSLTEITYFIKIALKTSDIENAYDSFVETFELYLHEVMEKGYVSPETETDSLNKEVYLMKNVIKTVVYKMYTELEILHFETKKEET